jgi:hypothetical protein
MGERHKTVTHVPRREHTESLAQSSGAATLVSDRNDASKCIRIYFCELSGDSREPLENSRKAGAAAEGDNSWTFGLNLSFRSFRLQIVLRVTPATARFPRRDRKRHLRRRWQLVCHAKHGKTAPAASR